MTKRKFTSAGALRFLFYAALFLFILLPEAVLAHAIKPRLVDVFPGILILFPFMVMLFTIFGGGYEIMEIQTSGRITWGIQWKPVVAVIGLGLAILDITLGFYIVGALILITIYQGISLIYSGICKFSSKHAKVPSGQPIHWHRVIEIVFILTGVLFFLTEGQISLWAVFGLLLIWTGFRSFQLIFFALYKYTLRNSKPWTAHANPWRLIPAGLMITAMMVVLNLAAYDAMDAAYQSKRARSAPEKSNLHNIFLACKAYWAESGSASSCNVDIASRTTYGYIQSADVVVAGKGGNEQNFNIIAMNQNSKKAFEINEVGAITQVEGEFRSESGRIVDMKVAKKVPEKPNLLSQAYNLLVDFYR